MSYLIKSLGDNQFQDVFMIRRSIQVFGYFFKDYIVIPNFKLYFKIQI